MKNNFCQARQKAVSNLYYYEKCHYMQAAQEFHQDLALSLRILRETCQAVLCDTLAQNDAKTHIDYEGHVVEDVASFLASQRVAAHIQKRGRHCQIGLSPRKTGSHSVPPRFPRRTNLQKKASILQRDPSKLDGKPFGRPLHLALFGAFDFPANLNGLTFITAILPEKVRCLGETIIALELH